MTCMQNVVSMHVDKCVAKAIMNIMMFVFMVRRGGAGPGAEYCG